MPTGSHLLARAVLGGALAIAVVASAACGKTPPTPPAVEAAVPVVAAAAGVGARPPAPAAASSSCPVTPWACYAHDAARTSASEGCAEGPLAIRWKLVRQGGCGFRSRAGRIVHAVADANAVFAAVDCGESPAVMRVTPDGAPLWTFSRGDYGRGSWPALASGGVLSADDGVFLIDRETGKRVGHELDVWGEPVVVGDTFYVDNTFQLDGAGPFVGALDPSLHWKWKASAINPGKGKQVPRTGGIAVSGDRVVHAAAMGAHSIPSLAAHDAATGERRWLAAGVWPESAPSVADGRVFTVERWHGEKKDRLVARSLADGAVVWSSATAWARGPAPVVAEKLVVVHGADGVRAYDAATGAVAWSNPAPRKAPFVESATTMAAALGSHTLVVTSGPRVIVLRLADGTEQWSGAVVSGGTPTSPGGVTVESPIVVGRSVYVTSDGALVRLDPPGGGG